MDGMVWNWFLGGVTQVVNDYYLGMNPGGSPWNSAGKPLLLVDPNLIFIDQLTGSIHHLLGCCVSPVDVLSVE